MRDVHRRDVVVTLFPFADQQKAKVRPVVVYAGPWFVEDFSVCWVLMITSARRKRWPGDINIADIAAAALPGDSVVRVRKIACIDTRNIVQKLGALDKTTWSAVQKAFDDSFQRSRHR